MFSCSKLALHKLVVNIVVEGELMRINYNHLLTIFCIRPNRKAITIKSLINNWHRMTMVGS